MTTTRADRQNYLDSLDNDEDQPLTTGDPMTPTTISLHPQSGQIIAHYHDRSVPIGQLSPDDRQAALALMAERFNAHEDLAKLADKSSALIHDALAHQHEAFGEDDDVDAGDLIEFMAGWRMRAAEALA